MMKGLVDYPSADEEFAIVERVTGAPTAVAAVASMAQLAQLQQRCRAVFVDPALVSWVVRLVGATRDPGRAGLKDLARHVAYGASPRASINLVEAGRALAFLRGRDYVLPEDLADLAPDVLRHRLVLSYEALGEGVTPEQLIGRLLTQLAPPARPLDTRARLAANP
jgi:MoxR-like ATPase